MRVKSCSSSTFWPGLFWFFTAATALRSRTACSCYMCRFNPLLALTAKLCSGTRRLQNRRTSFGNCIFRSLHFPCSDLNGRLECKRTSL